MPRLLLVRLAARKQKLSRRRMKSLRRPNVRACRSLGGCVTSTACSWPPVRPTAAKHAGRGSAPRSSRIQETFLTSAVSRRELKGTLSRAERRFPTWPIGDYGRVPRLPDCFRTPPPRSAMALPASPAPSPSKTTRPPLRRNGGLVVSESLWTNADDRLPVASLGRVEGGDSIVEGRDVADVRPQSSVPHPLDDLTQLGTIGLDHEVDCHAVGGPCLGRPYDGHQGSSGPDQALRTASGCPRR